MAVTDILQEITDRVEQMPPIGSAHQQLLVKLAGADYDVGEIVELIASDISLTVRVLQVVNSAAYGLPKQISTIQQGIRFLGSRGLIEIALLEGFRGVMDKPLRGYQSERGEFWEFSLRSALSAKGLAIKLNRPGDADIVYTAGLLHDMGKLILSEALYDLGKNLPWRPKIESGLSFVELEDMILGTNHMEIGERLATKWNMPDIICAAVRHHHVPNDAPEQFSWPTKIVHVASVLAMLPASALRPQNIRNVIAADIIEQFKLDDASLESLVEEIEEQFTSTMEKLGGNND